MTIVIAIAVPIDALLSSAVCSPVISEMGCTCPTSLFAANDVATADENAANAAATNAVVATCVVFVPAVAVGAVGVPVSAGLANGALSASAFVMVVAKFASFPKAAANSFSVSSVAGELFTNAANAAATNAVVASWVVFVPAVAVGAVGVPVSATSGFMVGFG